MDQRTELSVLSELSTVIIKNFSDEMNITLLPYLNDIVDIVHAHEPPNTVVSAALGVASVIEETSAVITMTQSRSVSNTTSRTLSLKERPIDIVIEKPLDENTMVNLMRLVGEYSPTAMSTDEMQTLLSLLSQNQLVDTLKHQRSGIRIVLQIPEQTFRPLYNLPPVFNQFTGRDEELELLNKNRGSVQLIAPKETESLVEHKVSKDISQISGTGGIGKSQLANHFARLQFKNKYFNWVIWLVGGVDEVAAENNLQSQLFALGIALGLDVEGIKKDVLYQLIYEKLARKGRGLIVIDDAPNYTVIKQFLPERFGHNNMEILMTTRNGRTFGQGIAKIILDVFTLEDAKHYIRKVLHEEIADIDAELLADTLDRYPLALTQALAYISDKGCNITEYCQRYKVSKEARRVYLDTSVNEGDPYEDERRRRELSLKATMWSVVQLSLERVKVLCENEEKYQQAMTVLMGAAYLAPEAAIPKKLLGGWLLEDKEELQIDQALEALRTLSLLEDSNKRSCYRIHQAVQDVLKIEESFEKVQQRVLKNCDIIHEYFFLKELSDLDQKSISLTIEPHVVVLLDYLSSMSLSDDLLVKKGFLLQLMGLASEEKGEQSKMRFYCESQLHCYQQMNSASKLLIESCKMNLASARLSCGETQTTIQILLESINFLKDNVGENEKIILGKNLMTLGVAMMRSGKNIYAQELLTEALAIIKAWFGTKHWLVAYCMMMLSGPMIDCDNLQGAKKLLVEALQIFEMTVGIQHAHYARCLGNMGGLMIRCGELQSAERYLSEAIRLLKASVGEGHADVGRVMNTIGACLLKRGELPSARAHFLKAISILKNSLGSQHGCVGETLINLARTSDPQEAIKINTEALSILINAYGKQHELVSTCLTSLGKVAFEIHDYVNAIKWYLDALPILKNNLGDRHSEVAICLVSLGSAYHTLGDPRRAQKYFLEALPILRLAFETNEKDVGICLMNLGAATHDCGDSPKAKRYLGEALQILKKSLGERDHTVALCMMNFGVAALSCEDAKSARVQLSQALLLFEQLVGKRHVNVGMCLMNLGWASLHCGEPLAGKRQLEEALSLLSLFLSPQHDTMRLCQNRLDRAIAFCAHLQNMGIDSRPSFWKTSPATQSNIPDSIFELIKQSGMPLSPALAFELAQYLFNIEQLYAALIVLEMIIDKNPGDAQAQLLKARCYVINREFDLAEDCIGMAASIDRDLDTAEIVELVNKARENYQALLKRYQDTLALGHLSPAEKVIFASILRGIGKNSEALAVLTELLPYSLDKDLQGGLFFQLARCHFINKNWKDALFCINKSIEIKAHPIATKLKQQIIESANCAIKIENLLSILDVAEERNLKNQCSTSPNHNSFH